MKKDTQKLFESYLSCIDEGKLDKALTYMVKLIDQGKEYPDAHTTACDKYKLNKKQGDQLQDMFDNMDEGNITEDTLPISGYDKEDKGKNSSTYYFGDTKSISKAKKDLESAGFKKDGKIWKKGKQRVEINVALTSKGGGTIIVKEDVQLDESIITDIRKLSDSIIDYTANELEELIDLLGHTSDSKTIKDITKLVSVFKKAVDTFNKESSKYTG